jgi:hypothetical protein
MREKSHKDGLTVWLENYGSWGFAGEFLQYGGQSDEVGGEFWLGNFLGKEENRCASSCAHIYGKKKVWSEAFTSGGGHYTDSPQSIKTRGDWAFADGVNAYILHVNIQQHDNNDYPGIDAWYCTQFNRKNTWFSQLDLFTTYIRRCGFMLQQGLDVADIAYYIGEDAPKMQGITTPQCPEGYHYDFINAEVLLKSRATPEKEGKSSLTLPHGTKYRVLVLPPQDTMRPEILTKILELAGKGVPVVGTAPKSSPSLQDYPKQDEQVKKLSEQLARLLLPPTKELAELLQWLPANLKPDFIVRDGSPVLYTHRRAGKTDIYFLSNQSDKRIQTMAQFRITGKQPEYWEPVTGKKRNLPAFGDSGLVTLVPLQLEAGESAFVVFRNKYTKEVTPIAKFVETTQIPTPIKVDIEKAVYGKLDEAAFTVDATEAVKKIVANGVCNVVVNDVTKAVGDPKFGFVKTLKITCKVDGKSVTFEGKDGDNMMLVPAKTEVEGAKINFPEREIIAELDKSWTVQFDGDEIHRGPAEPVTFDSLIDWSKHSDDRIKYYSGTAVYQTEVELSDLKRTSDPQTRRRVSIFRRSTASTSANTEPLYLDLGKVSVSAKVKVNGKYAGGVWTAPYRLDIAPFVKTGKNRIEVEVVNTWANRIIGDRKLPEPDRKLKISRGPSDNLQESGLLGPVQIVKGY